MVELPNGDHVHAPQLNTPYQEWTLVPWNMEPPAPSTNPADFPLSDWQLRLGLIHFGFSLESIESQIHGIADTPTRQTMWTQWDRPTVIYWDNPATAALMAFIGVTPEQAAPMWLYAKDLTM
ncbi:MAG: hypothetical protein P4M09_22810 [Devosia sp.]|nr:hypothetical protein [Devosia sp.]